jgi:subtilisin family serine protease
MMSAQPRPGLVAQDVPRIFAAGGAVAAVGVAGLLVPVRDAIGAANVALVLAIVVAGAAMLGGSVAGVITSLAASLSFDYFHTQPYFDLRIDKRDDVIAAVLLLVLGAAVGVFGSLRNGMRLDAQQQARGAAHLEDVAAVVAAGAGLDEAWPVIRGALLDQLDLRSCRFEPVPFEHYYPALGRDGHIDSSVLHYERGGFALPPEGASVPVVAGGRALGRLVLLPLPHRGTTRAQRRVAVALADQLAVAASRSGPLHAMS